MAIKVRKAQDRGHFDHGWLDTWHTFSFADYDDPEYRGFRVLRVINEDRIAGGQGFGTHGHRDMEILSYPISGVLAHKDSMGHVSKVGEGEIQYMSAGSGVTHSEFNGSDREKAHFLQIWILPDRAGYAPTYEGRKLSELPQVEGRRLLLSPEGDQGSIRVRQNARVWQWILSGGETREMPMGVGRFAWIQVARGALTLNDIDLSVSDGASVSRETSLRLRATEADCELLVFDLP
jgi:redox-sensitive bicupin YhaK (pirin superfamily)